MSNCSLFWPTNVNLANRICILLLSVFHVLILIFVATGWLLIPKNYKLLQLLYIWTIVVIIVLFCIFQKCVLQILKERLYTNKPKDCNLNILPTRKGPMFLGFSILLFIGIYNYFKI